MVFPNDISALWLCESQRSMWAYNLNTNGAEEKENNKATGFQINRQTCFESPQFVIAQGAAFLGREGREGRGGGWLI